MADPSPDSGALTRCAISSNDLASLQRNVGADPDADARIALTPPQPCVGARFRGDHPPAPDTRPAASELPTDRIASTCEGRTASPRATDAPGTDGDSASLDQCPASGASCRMADVATANLASLSLGQLEKLLEDQRRALCGVGEVAMPTNPRPPVTLCHPTSTGDHPSLPPASVPTDSDLSAYLTLIDASGDTGACHPGACGLPSVLSEESVGHVASCASGQVSSAGSPRKDARIACGSIGSTGVPLSGPPLAGVPLQMHGGSLLSDSYFSDVGGIIGMLAADTADDLYLPDGSDACFADLVPLLADDGYAGEGFEGAELTPGAGRMIGALTVEERLARLQRYREKRNARNFNKRIKYECRKTLADTRPRVRGRFARDSEAGAVFPPGEAPARQQ